jgi:hypothetical protein
MMKSPVDLLINLLQDIERLMPDVSGLDRDIKTIKARVEHEGDGFLTVALPAFCDALDRGLASGRFTCPTGFRKLRGGAIPRLLSGLLCKVFDMYTGELVDLPSLESVKTLREVTRFYKKLLLSSDREEILDRKAKETFLKCDQEIPLELSLDGITSYVLDRVCKFSLPSLDCFEEEELIYKHGPGAVAEALSSNQKWEELLECEFEGKPLGLEMLSRDRLLVKGLRRSGHSGPSSTARLVTVAKNSTSRRTITIEPLLKQFIQQGFNRQLRDSIKECRILSQCLALTDQTQNQKLAMIGSQTQYWATLDLSSASDRLSASLVSLVFRHHPKFLRGIFECRSPDVEVDSVAYAVRKYAGMGNATTFPVQSVVFAILAITALLNGVNPSYRNVKRAAKYVRVYGDDIIVPRTHYAQVVSLLESVGLVVNTSKSFSEGNFRESCGVDAYFGVDVTPLYCRRSISDISIKDPNAIAHFVELSNHAWLRGLYKVSDAIKSEVERVLARELPLVRRDSGALGWLTRKNHYSFERWNNALHRYEVFAPVLKTLHRRDQQDGWSSLVRYFIETSNEVSESLAATTRHLSPLERDKLRFTRSPVRFRSGLHKRWVPV